MAITSKQVVVSCPDCERPIGLRFQPVEGLIITCPHCQVELEVVSTHPLRIDFYVEEWDGDEEGSK